ncbi:hypothetical protein [Saccharicrinis sp. 156]|uniref:hypothetical protein n=1 Tax=Saccharicrinis sp. 156 TaxID=3417574 RepID=UPI003D34EF34
MSNIATYTFIPWVREGIANQIGGQSGVRATIPVELKISGDGVDGSTVNRPSIVKDIQIYGPGDITGLDPRTIIKVDPEPNLSNFEPNYLPYIDFYDEDLPWRYSPVSPSNHRLTPWIMLVVLKDDEFSNGKNVKDRPLPYILPKAGAKLPPPSQLWAWAHVHINKDLLGEDSEDNEIVRSTDAAGIQSDLVSTLNSNPDNGFARIMCPRKLEANVNYHAFLVPSFESGRLAGVGQDPSTAASHDTPAWTDSVLPTELPYYHRWGFKTGTKGDFEYLVRLLKPQPIDKRVGTRDMDVQKPGANIKGITDAPDATEEQKLGGILKLGGALKIPDIFYDHDSDEYKDIVKYRNWATLNGTQAYPHPFQSDLASFINLTDSYEEESALDANTHANITEEQTATDKENEFGYDQNPDPLITAPLYARWHSLSKRLLKTQDGSDISPNDNWVHELNLDPRWRSAAGFGTKVVQENQEDYMQSAWEQVGDILKSNKLIQYAQLSKEVSSVWYDTHLGSIQSSTPDRWLSVSAPMHKRILKDVSYHNGDQTTLKKATAFYEVKQSNVPQVTISTSFRKFTRPRGILMKRFNFDDTINVNNIISRINKNEVSAAPPRIAPPILSEHEKLHEEVRPTNIPDIILQLIKKYEWLKWVPFAIALLLIIIFYFILGTNVPYYATIVAIIGAMFYLFRLLNKWDLSVDASEVVQPENKTPDSVDDWPRRPEFKISLDGTYTSSRVGLQDSKEAEAFKTGTKDAYTLVQESIAASVPTVKPELDIAGINTSVYDSLQPETTIPKWVWGKVLIPWRIKEQLKETFVPAMAYPEIDLPMYKPLTEYSAELFLPNINFVAQNSISLLETNQPFIESYMVGLNHEFARELLWREYPTDQRGSYFRQFWEAIGYLDREGLSEEELKEKLRDIPPVHLWSKYSDLGDHDHREEPGDNEEEVVLVIRGELLKKYPNAVIYAHKAVWRDEDGNPVTDEADKDKIDPKQERDLWPLTDTEQNNPPSDIVKTPLYEAKVSPDIHFFGFDLTTCEAKGGTGDESIEVDPRCASNGITWDDPGWFFVIKERPGEPRFGLDIGGETSNVEGNKIELWNDLSWTDITPAVADGGFIQITNQTPTITADQDLELPEDAEKEEQQSEDMGIIWNKDMSSADLAYILYQVPVLVAVHATEMLPNTD